MESPLIIILQDGGFCVMWCVVEPAAMQCFLMLMTCDDALLLIVLSPDHAPFATRGNGLATFLVEGAEHYQDLGNDQSDISIPQFHMMVIRLSQ